MWVIDKERREKTYHAERPAVVADYERLVVLEDGDLEREDDEGQDELRYV